MKQYNPLKMYLNMPVEYIAEVHGDVILSGHFAFYDEDGYPYVFDTGGTSYTRTKEQVIKCKMVSAMTDNSQGVHYTNEMSEFVLQVDNEVNNTNVLEQIANTEVRLTLSTVYMLKSGDRLVFDNVITGDDIHFEFRGMEGYLIGFGFNPVRVSYDLRGRFDKILDIELPLELHGKNLDIDFSVKYNNSF